MFVCIYGCRLLQIFDSRIEPPHSPACHKRLLMEANRELTAGVIPSVVKVYNTEPLKVAREVTRLSRNYESPSSSSSSPSSAIFFINHSHLITHYIYPLWHSHAGIPALHKLPCGVARRYTGGTVCQRQALHASIPALFSKVYWHQNAQVIEIQTRQQLKNNFVPWNTANSCEHFLHFDT